MTKMTHDDRREHPPQRLGGPLLVLELAAPLDVDALGQLHLLGDDPLGLLDEADDVAAADVERDVVQQPAVLALDHGRPFGDPHVGHGRERDQPLPLGGVLGDRLRAARRRNVGSPVIAGVRAPAGGHAGRDRAAA